MGSQLPKLLLFQDLTTEGHCQTATADHTHNHDFPSTLTFPQLPAHPSLSPHSGRARVWQDSGCLMRQYRRIPPHSGDTTASGRVLISGESDFWPLWAGRMSGLQDYHVCWSCGAKYKCSRCIHCSSNRLWSLDQFDMRPCKILASFGFWIFYTYLTDLV